MRRPLTEPPGSLHVPREIFGYRGLCLQPAGSVALAGAGLETAGCSGAAAQKWTFTTRGEVRHRASGLCLRDGEDGRPALAACATGDARQAWLRAFSGDLVGHSGLCLDVAGASASDPAPVILWPCTASGSENQKWWSFYPEVQGSGGPPN
jgi:alpha-galactosidase